MSALRTCLTCHLAALSQEEKPTDISLSDLPGLFALAVQQMDYTLLPPPSPNIPRNRFTASLLSSVPEEDFHGSHIPMCQAGVEHSSLLWLLPWFVMVCRLRVLRCLCEMITGFVMQSVGALRPWLVRVLACPV